MIDENAFGLLVAYFDIEDEEYELEVAEFAERVSAFRAAWRAALEPDPLPEGTLALDLGHALYLEFAEDARPSDPVALLRAVRSRLADEDFESVGVLTFGGRWLAAEGEPPRARSEELAGVQVHQLSLPSEPLRHALDADAATRMTTDEEPSGWGPGLYLEDEAIEALGRKLKNVPTALEAGGATFYRISR